MGNPSGPNPSTEKGNKTEVNARSVSSIDAPLTANSFEVL